MFKGLSAFPLTPFTGGTPDEKGFLRILRRLTDAKVDSLGVLGSTGSYAYLTREQRGRIARLAVENAGNIPVMVCVGAVSTDEVLRLADELHGKIAALPGVHSIKIPGVPADSEAASSRVRNLRNRLPADVTIGISGDSSAATGLIAGCEIWYSVCGGLFPAVAKRITEAAAAGDHTAVRAQNEHLSPLWALFDQHGGSFRVISAAAGLLGLTDDNCLPRPLLPLRADQLTELRRVILELELA